MNACREFGADRDARRSRTRVSIALAVFVSTTIPLRAQDAPSATPELPTISGRVVRESDGSPVVGATVEPNRSFKNRDVTTTDERGEFVRVGKAESRYTTATNHEPYDFVAYWTISAPGVARTLVDPCSDAPWAAPIRVRGTGTIRGRVDLAPKDQVNHVVVLANWKDLCWPPRTGLTRVDLRWLGDLDVDGRFEIRDVPAEVPLTLCWNAGTSGSRGIELQRDLALAPGEVREMVLIAPARERATNPEPVPIEGPWSPVFPIADEPPGVFSNLLAFEIVEGGRFKPHRVGGGRWHMHGSRACNDIEAQPGLRTLVAFDARGLFGCTTIDVPPGGLLTRPRVAVAPGALLRIAFDGPEERARIGLTSNGIEFAARTLPRGVVWYELAPSGQFGLHVTSASAEPRGIEVEVHAGRIERVEL